MQYNYKLIIKKIDIKKELERRGITSNLISGNNLMICCPFHGESNPSMGITLTGDKKGVYNCLACGEKGNLFHFISFVDNVSFEDAIKKYVSSDIDLATLKKLKSYFYNSLSEKNNKNDKIKVIGQKFLLKFKKPYGDFLDYLLKNRKLTKQTIKKFGILCCDEGKWKNRVIIPILDRKKRLISCTARYIYECEKYEKVRKVKDSDIGKVLFGIHNIKDRSKVVLVEGEFDMIYLQQFGIPAIQSGKNPTEYQINKIIQFVTDKCTISFDGDVERKHIIEVRKKLSKYISTDVLYLPLNKDPNDLSFKDIKKIYKEFL